MATTYLTHTFGSAGDQKTFTISFWLKRSELGADMQIFGQQASSYFRIILKAANNGMRCYSPSFDLTPSQLFRDVSGWYHVCLQMDTTESVAADRANLYINGVKVTVFDTETYPSLNDDLPVNNAQIHQIGRGASIDYFDGLLSHFYFIDGTAYPASTFGSTDADTGEWVVNTSPTVTMGTNGFLIMKDGNTITDQSSNSNDWALGGGTLTNTEDCPSDVFATFNVNLPMNSTMSVINGNTRGTTASNYEAAVSNSWFSTIGFDKGKFYAEFKVITSPSVYCVLGVGFDLSNAQQGSTTSQNNFISSTYGFAYQGQGEVGNDGVGFTSSGYDSYTATDIVGIAVDVDNWELYVSKGGVWQNSADPSAGTGGYSITADKEYYFAYSDNQSAAVFVVEANFGNGYFGTTAISSEGTNASNIGKFEYDVPTGFTALSTKGLNE